jgi:hypothetical protein
MRESLEICPRIICSGSILLPLECQKFGKEKGELSVLFLTEHHAMKEYWGVEV